MNEPIHRRSTDRAPFPVFLHGGVHSSTCWDQTIQAMTSLRPDTEFLAVDLPGRQGVPGDLATLTIDDCVSSVCDQILRRTRHDPSRPLVMIGHSLAGVVLPSVVDKLGHDIVRQAIFVAACVPPPGQCVIDTLPTILKPYVRYLARRTPVIVDVPHVIARWFFGNGATRRQRTLMQAQFCRESSRLLTEVVTASLPESVRTSWILTSHDRALTPAIQRRFIESLGGVDDMVVIDSGHEVMFTHPGELAAAIRLLTRWPRGHYRLPRACPQLSDADHVSG